MQYETYLKVSWNHHEIAIQSSITLNNHKALKLKKIICNNLLFPAQLKIVHEKCQDANSPPHATWAEATSVSSDRHTYQQYWIKKFPTSTAHFPSGNRLISLEQITRKTLHTIVTEQYPINRHQETVSWGLEEGRFMIMLQAFIP